MRIVKRAEFMQLPEGVIFALWNPYEMDCLMVKGTSVKSDERGGCLYLSLKDTTVLPLEPYRTDALDGPNRKETAARMNAFCAGEHPTFDMPLSMDSAQFLVGDDWDDRQLFAVWTERDLVMLKDKVSAAIGALQILAEQKTQATEEAPDARLMTEPNASGSQLPTANYTYYKEEGVKDEDR